MTHYYTENESLQDVPSQIRFELNGRNFILESNAGVFSKDKLDTGTRILLETVLENSRPCPTVLDLGCGIGVAGVVMGTFWDCRVTGIDVNERACRLARMNYEAAGIQGEVLHQDGITQGKYSCILLNPPIRTGKETIYRLFRQACEHLEENGSLWIVIRKQHGAASAQKYLETELKKKAVRIGRDKGFWVLKVTNE